MIVVITPTLYLRARHTTTHACIVVGNQCPARLHFLQKSPIWATRGLSPLYASSWLFCGVENLILVYIGKVSVSVGFEKDIEVWSGS